MLTVAATHAAPGVGVRGTPFRVLHHIPTLGGGGAERQLSLIAAEQRRQGLDVHVATLAAGENLAWLESGGVQIHRLPRRRSTDPRSVLEMIRLMRRVQPDVVQTWLTRADLVGGMAASITGRPWMLFENSSAKAYPAGLLNTMRTRLARRAGAVVSNSQGGNTYWSARLPETIPRAVIGNAIPFGEIALATAEPRITRSGSRIGRPTILFAGRFSPEKNLDRLMRALQRVLEQREAHAVLCGDGPDWPRIVEEARRHDIADRVHFEGYSADIWGWMKYSDVFISPSLFEGRPNTVLEAAACGCPLVLSDIPAHRELFGDDSAMFFDPMSVDGIARALVEALDDAAATKQRADRARAIVGEYTVERVVHAFSAVYAQMTGTRTTAGV